MAVQRAMPFFGLALCLAAASTIACSAIPQSNDTWDVHAVRYATLENFPVWALIEDADTSRTLDIAMMFWVLQSERRTVLIDAGSGPFTVMT